MLQDFGHWLLFEFRIQSIQHFVKWCIVLLSVNYFNIWWKCVVSSRVANLWNNTRMAYKHVILNSKIIHLKLYILFHVPDIHSCIRVVHQSCAGSIKRLNYPGYSCFPTLRQQREFLKYFKKNDIIHDSYLDPFNLS